MTFDFDILYSEFEVDALNFDVELWKLNILLIRNLEFVFCMVNVSLWILGFTGKASWRQQEGQLEIMGEATVWCLHTKEEEQELF